MAMPPMQQACVRQETNDRPQGALLFCAMRPTHEMVAIYHDYHHNVQAPPVLTLHLKRFSYHRGGGFGFGGGGLFGMFGGGGGQKIQSQISFPDVLNITPLLSKEAVKEVRPFYVSPTCLLIVALVA